MEAIGSSYCLFGSGHYKLKVGYKRIDRNTEDIHTIRICCLQDLFCLSLIFIRPIICISIFCLGSLPVILSNRFRLVRVLVIH